MKRVGRRLDPELLLRILLIGYLFGIPSERKLVEELRCISPGGVEISPLNCKSETGALPGCKPVNACQAFTVTMSHSSPEVTALLEAS